MNLTAAGVTLDDAGAVAVNDALETSQPHIRALGDVKGGLQFTYISLDDFRIVRDALWGDGVRSTGNRGPVAYTVFMDPPLARVGLTEAEARAQGLAVTVAELPAAAIPRARLLGETTGLLKAVVESGSRQDPGLRPALRGCRGNDQHGDLPPCARDRIIASCAT